MGMSTAPSCATINLSEVSVTRAKTTRGSQYLVSGGGAPSYLATIRLFSLQDESIRADLIAAEVSLI